MKKSNNLLTKLELLYASPAYVAVHKDPGVPCQTRNNKPPYPLDESMQHYLNEPLKIWTRIDQPVSGLVLFYRDNTPSINSNLRIVEKQYLGIVEGHPEKENGIIQSNLRRDGRKMKSVEDVENGKHSELSYSVIKRFDRYSLLIITPVTGRFHQIRQQLSQLGHPIKGDVKYGARRKNHDRSIHLHALKYVVRIQEEDPVHHFDYSFPDDPLWTLTNTLIRQQEITF